MPIVEDAAQAVGAEHDGRRAGTFGSAAAFSFYPTKNLGGVGDGGAVVTADAELAERVRILRGYGQAGGVIGGAAGLNSRLDALQAAVLSVKLAHLDGWLERRRSIAERYSGVLAPLGLETPIVEPGNRHGFHLYTLCVDEREAFRARLAAEGVETAIHYPIPAHRHGAFAHGRLPAGGLPVTDRLAGRVVSLPIWPQLTEAEVERVIEAAAGSASR